MHATNSLHGDAHTERPQGSRQRISDSLTIGGIFEVSLRPNFGPGASPIRLNPARAATDTICDFD
jgi:hypothetical protein